MSDYILIDGDQAIFDPKSFGLAKVAPRPGKMSGSGKAGLNGKKFCVDGDEKKLQVPGCVYMTPTHSIAGVGTLKIDKLTNHKAQKTKSGGKPVLLKGGDFIAKFEVQSPAQQPPKPPAQPNPIPDSSASYPGQGSFLNTNSKIKGT